MDHNTRRPERAVAWPLRVPPCDVEQNVVRRGARPPADAARVRFRARGQQARARACQGVKACPMGEGHAIAVAGRAAIDL